MELGILARKVGMTRIFTEAGKSLPVTVLHAITNRVTQIKTVETDGYNAIQITGGEKKPSRVNKPMTGHFAKAKVDAGDMISEFTVSEPNIFNLGQEISLSEVFKLGCHVDVTAVSKGKGFAGTVKRHNFATQDATHGNSRSHRVPGSIGQNQTPGRVFKGKKMAGHMGNKRCTIQTLELLKIDEEKGLLLIKGAVPGAPGARVKVKHAVKKMQTK